ncbi:MAG TPA: hypothetical protein VKR30_03785 [Candidatus Limnocylindrales bacterium]|nr:hypothetical protein [Candidatus Limnocylindrales bacterium]
MRPVRGVRDLAVAATVVIAMSRFVDGQLAWLMAALIVAAVAFGALQVIGAAAPQGETTGIPIESVIPPALAAVGGAGLLRIIPEGLLLIPALAVIAWFVERVATTEARLARSANSPSAADRSTVLVEALVAGFGAFVGIAAIAAGGLTLSSGGIPPTTAGPFERGALAVADGLVAFLLAYRIAALRSSVARDVAWMATTAAAVVTIASALLRQVEIPGILGPALLVLVLFLWDAIHGSPPARRRDPRRLAETALLVVLGVVVVAWSIGLRT